MTSFAEECRLSEIIKDNFVTELKNLLKKYNATMSAGQCYEGCPSVGQGETIFVMSDEFELNLGKEIMGD